MQRSFWQEFRRQPIEPWSWWLTRHQIKVFAAGLLMVIVF